MALRLFDGLGTGRVAMSLASAGSGHAVSNRGFDGNQRRAIGNCPCFVNSILDRYEVVAIRNRGGVPAIALEPLRHSFRKGQ
jgi:hypothetical protein